MSRNEDLTKDVNIPKSMTLSWTFHHSNLAAISDLLIRRACFFDARVAYGGRLEVEFGGEADIDESRICGTIRVAKLLCVL